MNLVRVFKEHWQKTALVDIYHFSVLLFSACFYKNRPKTAGSSLLLRQ